MKTFLAFLTGAVLWLFAAVILANSNMELPLLQYFFEF